MNNTLPVSKQLIQKGAITMTLAISATLSLTTSAIAATLRVTVDNLAPINGNFLTPVWVGFHDGSFDIYDRDVSLDFSQAQKPWSKMGTINP